MSHFKDLLVWQRSRALARSIYHATERFPADERDGLRSQMRRAAVSIASNIAEGSARHTLRDQTRFYRTAVASSRELESLVAVAEDVGLIDSAGVSAIERQLDEVQRMLSGLVRYAAGGKRPRRGEHSTPNSYPRTPNPTPNPERRTPN